MSLAGLCEPCEENRHEDCHGCVCQCDIHRHRVISQHTREPWEFAAIGSGKVYIGHKANTRHDPSPLICYTVAGTDVDRVNAARIVLCVNALAGMSEAEIDTMRQIWKERNK